MPPKPASELTADELRNEASITLKAILHEARVLQALKTRMAELEAPLLHGPKAMRSGEGIALAGGGVLKRHKFQSGRSFVVKDEVDKNVGELPEELRPIKDHEFKALESNLPPALAAELRVLATEDPEDTPVTITPKDKYATVAAFRKEFGDENAYVGKPPKPEHIVLEFEGFTDDKPLILSVDGLAEPK